MASEASELRREADGERGERVAAGSGGRLRRALQLLTRAARAIRAERVQVRAMALTYISLFALVPALVVAFSVVQAFTGLERITRAVHELLLQNLAVGARASVEPALDSFVKNAHVARAGLVGGALLLWSAYSLFFQVEGAVNDLWEVQRRRALRSQILTYWMGLTLGPLLLAGSATLGQVAQAFLESRGVRALVIGSAALLSSGLLTILYLVLPNARVRLRAALAGGVAAGVGWEVAKWLFAWFVTRVVRYHAIYGSVAAVPVFLTWLYVSWSIVLFGARLAFVVQHPRSAMASGLATRGGRELLAGQAMVLAASAFEQGTPAPSAHEVVRALRAGPGAHEIVEQLTRGGLLRVLAGGGLVPARPPADISLLDVRRATSGEEPPSDQKLAFLRDLFREADERAGERLCVTSIRDLCERGEVSRGPTRSSPA